jgi:hypothetical protein
MRELRTRSSPSALRSPLTPHPFGAGAGAAGSAGAAAEP